MWAPVEIAPIERLFPARKILFAVFVADNAHIPLRRPENFKHVLFGVVDDDLVDVFASSDLDLALDDALDRLDFSGRSIEGSVWMQTIK